MLILGIAGIILVGLAAAFTGIVMSAAPRKGLSTSTVQMFGALLSVIISAIILQTGLFNEVDWHGQGVAKAIIFYSLTGGLNFLMLQAVAMGMKKGPNSIVWVITQSGMVLTFMFGVIFLGDILNIFRIFGIILLFNALVCLGIGKNKAAEENNQGKSKVWIAWAFLAFLLCGSNQITNTIPSYDMNVQSNFNYAARALFSAGATVIFALIWNLIANAKECLKQIVCECRNPWLWFFVVAMQGLSLCCTYLLQYRCLDILATYNTASIAYPLLVSTCLCGFTLYSFMVLKEKLTCLQLIGLALSLIGIILICVKQSGKEVVMKSDNWPFIIVRVWGLGDANKEFLENLYDWNKENPNIIEELWFANSNQDTVEAQDKIIEELKPFRQQCLDNGIKFSLQQGNTLGHYPAPHAKNYSHFSEEDWAMNCDGERIYGVLCANSDNVREYTRKIAEKYIKELEPASYWPDDDLRLIYKDLKEVCFCDKCIKKFNEMFNYNYTRESLSNSLFGENISGEVRKNWTLFNSRSLGEYASCFAQAVENLNSDCRLGIQAVYSSWIYDGPDLLNVLKGLSGKNKKTVGIRPGACYYDDHDPAAMLEKSLAVMQEANRCATYGDLVGQICYEAENWPHVSVLKSPSSQMTECSLALASGCDSLALYWGSDRSREPDENYQFYWQTLKKFYPYFEAIRRASKDTVSEGMAFYRGEDIYATERWQIITDSIAERRLIYNALPIVRGGKVKVWVVDKATVEELLEDDLPKLFAENVLIDTLALEKLKEKFPNLAWANKVELIKILSGQGSNSEVFENGYSATNLERYIDVKSSDVTKLSKVENSEYTASCIISTEFGGKVILIQEIAFASLWTTYRREMLLDALDKIMPEKMSARLYTGGFSVYPIVRVRENGEVAGVFLLNTSIGETMEMKLAIRGNAAKKYLLHRAGYETSELKVTEKSDSEVTLKLPALNGWQSMFIEVVK